MLDSLRSILIHTPKNTPFDSALLCGEHLTELAVALCLRSSPSLFGPNLDAMSQLGAFRARTRAYCSQSAHDFIVKCVRNEVVLGGGTAVARVWNAVSHRRSSSLGHGSV